MKPCNFERMVPKTPRKSCFVFGNLQALSSSPMASLPVREAPMGMLASALSDNVS